MNVHLINPSSVSFGTAVITPRWQYVLAAATPKSFGDPILVDETLFQVEPESIKKGDAVGIGIHTANALRGYEIGKMARERGAFVIFGGIHATLFPEEAMELGGAHAVVKGDGDLAWPRVLADCCNMGGTNDRRTRFHKLPERNCLVGELAPSFARLPSVAETETAGATIGCRYREQATPAPRPNVERSGERK